MNITLFLSLISLLALLCILIGKQATKNLQSNEDYFLMGRKLKLIPLSMTLLATQLGGGTLLGAAEEAYKSGFAVLFYPLGASIGLIVLGFGFGKKFRSLNISTIAEIFEKIYRSKKLRQIASILSIVTMFFILVAQSIAARKFFVSIGIDSYLFFTMCWAAVIIYTVLGGLKAVVNTDILQASLILVVLGSSLFFLTKQTAETSISIQEISKINIKGVSWTNWLLMPLLFMLIEQDMGQRCFAAKKTKIIPTSTIIAATLLFLGSSIAILFGTLAKNLTLSLSSDSCILLESIKAMTNTSFTTVFMVAIFMAIISTADSLLCSISSNLCCDFIFSKNTNTKRKLYLSKMLTALIGILALGISYFFNSVVTVLMISYELSVCILCVPIIAAMSMKNVSKNSAWLSMGFGAISFVTFRFIDTNFPKEIISIACSIFGYALGGLLNLKNRNEIIKG